MARRCPHTVLMTGDTIGGVWTYALELARSYQRHGVRVALATMGEALDATQQAEARQLDNLEIFESHYQLEWMADPWRDIDRAGDWLLSLEAKLRPDLIHLNGYVHGALPWQAPTLMVGHSCVLSWWDAVKGQSAPGEWTTYHRQVQRGLRAAGMVVAPTRAMLEALDTHYELLRGGRVIPNGRAASAFRPGKKQPLIFAAGRLGDEAKNISLLGAVAARLPWRVAVAGHEVDASGHQPVEGELEHLGYLAPADLARVVSRASIYCLPARYEPFGLSILEAALAGCALVLGDIPSLRELWGEVAIFVSPHDERGLHAALQRLIDHPEERERLAHASRQRALQFTPQRTAAAYLDAYAELLTPTPAPVSTPDRLGVAP
jgi:glycogen synthase